jgi:hypothetical protein
VILPSGSSTESTHPRVGAKKSRFKTPIVEDQKKQEGKRLYL